MLQKKPQENENWDLPKYLKQVKTNTENWKLSFSSGDKFQIHRKSCYLKNQEGVSKKLEALQATRLTNICR